MTDADRLKLNNIRTALIKRLCSDKMTLALLREIARATDVIAKAARTPDQE